MKTCREYTSGRPYRWVITGHIFSVCIGLSLCGCGNPSRKELSNVFGRTESLAIFSIPDCRKPHFHPSAQFNWDSLFEGMSEGGNRAIADVQGWYAEDPFSGIIIFSYITGSFAAGGISNARQMPSIMRSHFQSTLSIAFKDQNSGDQVARIIQEYYREKYPQLYSRRIYWSDRECAEYMTGSCKRKKQKIDELSKSAALDGNRMLLIIHGKDYGLSGGTAKEPASCFFMTVCAELIRTQDGRQYYYRKFEYKSVPRVLKEWEADKYRMLKEEFDTACQNIGDRISDDLFGVNAYCGS